MTKKCYDVKNVIRLRSLICVPIRIFMFMHIAVILSKIFNILVLFLTLYNENILKHFRNSPLTKLFVPS